MFHYLDDFLVIGNPASADCDAQLAIVLAAFKLHGIPIAPEKLEGPTSCLTFLGIELDTVAMEMRLPQAKLIELRTLVQSWSRKRSCEKRELSSLIGKLQHASKVVRPGRTFLRRMFEQLVVAKKMHHHVRLNQSFRSDLAWWEVFLVTWNGVSLLKEVVLTSRPHFMKLSRMPQAAGGEGPYGVHTGYSTSGVTLINGRQSRRRSFFLLSLQW